MRTFTYSNRRRLRRNFIIYKYIFSTTVIRSITTYCMYTIDILNLMIVMPIHFNIYTPTSLKIKFYHPIQKLTMIIVL